MRRITSFIARRVDKPDAPSTTSSNDTDPLPQRKARTFNSLSRKLAPSLRPHLLASDSAYSSSSASSPDEEVLPRTLSQRGSWKSWLGAKKHRNEDLKAAAGLPPFPTTPIALCPPPRFNDTDDTSSELEDDLITQARDNMRAMILNSSVDPPSSPPLLDIPGSSPFPRSCLRSSDIHRRNTLECKMHQTALLRMLDSLSPAEERSIAPLGARPVILVKEAQAQDPDVDVYPNTRLLRRSSGSLGDWVDRPCFEDRVLVWTRQEPSGQIVSADVAGSQYFGVAALEFSEPLQILAGFEDQPDPKPSQPDSGTAAVALSSSMITPVADFEFSPLTLAVDYPETLESTKMISPKQEQAEHITPVPRVKRGVRFAEDGKDDQIPLGYVLRIKKKREEKARFLREEREKRELEEKTRIREEQHWSRLLEAERAQQEKEHKAFELQKKKMEEEKRRQNYATELQASRSRREASRAGHISSSSSLIRGIEERDRSASRDARPPAANPSLYDGSPASSMPPTPQGSQRSFSRPASVYSSHTTSSEDVRARDGRHISRRSTLAFDPSKQYTLPLPNHHPSLLPYNLWTNVQAQPVVPMITTMPFYSMDIPLLPPSPPFMMNQSGYRQRPTNSQGQFSSFQHNSSSNHTAEGIRHTSRAAQTHQRRASDEARGHSSSANVLPDRRYGSQTDLQGKRSSQVARSSRGSNLHHSHRSPALLHSHTSPAMPVSTSQSRSTPNRRQSVYS